MFHNHLFTSHGMCQTRKYPESPDGRAASPPMSTNAHNNKNGKIEKFRQQLDNFGKYGDFSDFLPNR